MRIIAVAGAGAALMMAGTAEAQMPGAHYPMPGRGPMPGGGPVYHPPMPQAPRTAMPGRWGSQVGGRWWGGANAPGGWAAYRRPYRGYRLPTYWIAPRFYVGDWSRYGLGQPGGGYRWVRYYDDAVLIDGQGAVYDTRSDLDWDGGYDERASDMGDGRGVDRGYAERRGDSAVGGAVVGAVVGGVAGNVIAGRGDKLGGTLIGAGVGAAAGYGVARAVDHDRRGPPPGYRDGEPPMAPDGPPPPYREQRRVIIHRGDTGAGYPPPGPPPVLSRGRNGGGWVSADGRTTVTTSGGYGGAAPVIVTPGYGYGGGSVTTITIQSAPVVTTTTTEIIEDVVTYSRPVVRRRVVRARVWHARPRPRPRPHCVCGS